MCEGWIPGLLEEAMLDYRCVSQGCYLQFSCRHKSLPEVHGVQSSNDDVFWRRFVNKAVSPGKVETQLWDFKETLSLWHAANGPEKEKAKVAFAEDVASFANARGGVLVVGVSDKRQIVGISDDPHQTEQRLKFAADALEKHLEYGRNIQRFHQSNSARFRRLREALLTCCCGSSVRGCRS
jgi:hypothetical protein